MAGSKRAPAPGPSRGPEAADGSDSAPRRDWREIYVAHPYLWAAIPIALGVVAALIAVWRRHVFGYVVGVSIAGFGLMIEALNLADSIWRAARRRRAGRAARKGGAPPVDRRPAG